MRIQHFLAAFVALLLAVPALAVDPGGEYPAQLHDSACTDLYDDPGAVASPTTSVRSQRVQTSGSPDGLCDADSAIGTGTITADKQFIIENPDGHKSIILEVDFDETASGTWRFCTLLIKGYDGTPYANNRGFNCTSNFTGDDEGFAIIGPTSGGGFVAGAANDIETTRTGLAPIPKRFVLLVDFLTATSAIYDLSYQFVQ